METLGWLPEKRNCADNCLLLETGQILGKIPGICTNRVGVYENRLFQPVSFYKDKSDEAGSKKKHCGRFRHRTRDGALFIRFNIVLTMIGSEATKAIIAAIPVVE